MSKRFNSEPCRIYLLTAYMSPYHNENGKLCFFYNGTEHWCFMVSDAGRRKKCCDRLTHRNSSSHRMHRTSKVKKIYYCTLWLGFIAMISCVVPKKLACMHFHFGCHRMYSVLAQITTQSVRKNIHLLLLGMNYV